MLAESRSRCGLLAALSVSAAACASLNGGQPAEPRAQPPKRAEPPSTSTPAEPSATSERPAATHGSGAPHRSAPSLAALQLPRSAAVEPLPEAIVPVVVSGAGLWLGPELTPVLGQLPGFPAQAVEGVGLENKASRQSPYVLPLAAQAKAMVCGAPDPSPTAVLFADERLPLRTLVDVVYTLGRGFESILLGASGAGNANRKVGMLPLRLSAEAATKDGVTLSTSSTGIAISSRDGSRQGAGCTPGAATPTINQAAGELPLDALEQCVRILYEGRTDRVTIAAPPETPFGDIVKLATAARRGLGTSALFTELVLVVGPLSPPPATRGAPTREASGSSNTAVGEAQDPVAGDATVASSMQDGFRACYEAELATDPRASGRVVVVVKVTASGRVESVSVEPRAVLSPIHACLRNAAAAVHFDPPEGGRTVFRVPIHFVPDTAKAPQAQPPCWREPPAAYTPPRP